MIKFNKNSILNNKIKKKQKQKINPRHATICLDTT
jgi:hypothetical protein